MEAALTALTNSPCSNAVAPTRLSLQPTGELWPLEAPQSKRTLIPLPWGEPQQPLWISLDCTNSVAGNNPCWAKLMDQAWEGGWDPAGTTDIKPAAMFSSIPLPHWPTFHSCASAIRQHQGGLSGLAVSHPAGHAISSYNSHLCNTCSASAQDP